MPTFLFYDYCHYKKQYRLNIAFEIVILRTKAAVARGILGVGHGAFKLSQAVQIFENQAVHSNVLSSLIYLITLF